MFRKHGSVRNYAHLLKASGLFDSAWYAARHGGAVMKEINPWENFLSVGWALGRDPGPGFDTRAYLARYGDVAESQMDALSHYLLHGAAEGRMPLPDEEEPIHAARAVSDALRTRLNVLGQQSAIQKLERLAREGTGDAAGFAGRDMALWHLRQWRERRDRKSAELAGAWARTALRSATNQTLRSRLLTVMLLADCIIGRPKPSVEELKHWDTDGLISAETWFALSYAEKSPDTRLSMLNRALHSYNLVPLTLCSGITGSPYDQLVPAEKVDLVTGPLVSVLIAAFEAEDTILTAIRAMKDQTWRNLEIIVIDDASADRTAEIVERESLTDPRIKLLRMPENRGAYCARNFGLASATGDFVAIHDADDWCHPERIARQMAFMSASNQAIACTSEHVRIHPDLRLTRISPEAHFLTENTASLIFRRQPVVEALGCWDEVRVAADNELIRRIRTVFGPKSVASLQTGPLAMLRDREGSAVGSGPLAIDGYVKGARLAYLDAQEHFHRTASPSALRYSPGGRPFPAPRVMQGKRNEPHALSLILAADFRHPDRVVDTCLHLISVADGPVGLVPLARPMTADNLDLPFRLCENIHRVLDGHSVVQICPGETASSPLLVLPDAEALSELPIPLPTIEASKIRILAVCPPVSKLPVTGRRITRYATTACEVSAQKLAKGSVEWVALNADVRAELIKSNACRVSRKLLKVTNLRSLLR